MTYDSWKTSSPDDGQPDLARCHRCNALCGGEEDDYGEFTCEDCKQDAAEAAWERHQDWLMENGPGPTLAEQQADARRLK